MGGDFFRFPDHEDVSLALLLLPESRKSSFFSWLSAVADVAAAAGGLEALPSW